jgi:hypothetical protein
MLYSRLYSKGCFLSHELISQEYQMLEIGVHCPANIQIKVLDSCEDHHCFAHEAKKLKSTTTRAKKRKTMKRRRESERATKSPLYSTNTSLLLHLSFFGFLLFFSWSSSIKNSDVPPGYVHCTHGCRVRTTPVCATVRHIVSFYCSTRPKRREVESRSYVIL